MTISMQPKGWHNYQATAFINSYDLCFARFPAIFPDVKRNNSISNFILRNLNQRKKYRFLFAKETI